MMIRTRFAPSPTGFLHIGGVRTALFSWAFARKHHGKFVLRIEDTDLERSTAESVQAILDGMHWVGLDYDEGPFYQTKRFDRYGEVLQQLLAAGHAYYDYTTKEELDAMRQEAEAKGEHFWYDRRWRPEEGKTLPPVPEGVQPVVRFKMPLTGETAWQDLVKGQIAIANHDLDDLIIARADGSPTYNFCVVVDDFDMGITHVIRGDDHVNNTPKQINILLAMEAELPQYAHLPMILNEKGAKMSKRRDAVSVVDYDRQGILPEALLNYLARLGWGHGDDEFFTMAQFIDWFDLKDVSPSASRFDHEKLLWLNAQHIKASDDDRLAQLIRPRLLEQGIDNPAEPALTEVIALVKDRAQDLNQLADECAYFYRKKTPTEQELAKHWDADTPARMQRFAALLAELPQWNAESIHALFAPFCEAESIKMGKLGMPLRLAVCGTGKTPSIDQVLALMGRQEVLQRLQQI
ncbi:glutamate--tRNA ligase [Snodgrassella sp. B3882]|uniref:glutamate--tRNA ligase n=1 Tax=Snodgrassella sp. B3882 TaxID=2818037 RepID=UPI00226AFAFA|nr:glutamate--tRNA ligase [Snodgrassella sp. B3882]MCX8745182.1 glutamate--tRNA ligase [Snodgrassella sp. B3882]